jgi:hypothetical protein
VTLAYLSLLADLYDGQGNPVASGTAAFSPSAPLTDAGVQVIPQAPLQAVFRPGSAPPSVSILPTDASGPAPAGWGWNVTFTNVPGSPAAFTFFAPAGPVAFSATQAAPALFTFTPSTYFTVLPAGTGVQLSGGGLPGGFTSGTTYYVVNPSGYTFELATTVNGSPITSTSAGTGEVTAVSYRLSALSPVSNATAMAGYLQLPSGGTPAEGQVPIATGDGQQTAWGDVLGDVLGQPNGAAQLDSNGFLLTSELALVAVNNFCVVSAAPLASLGENGDAAWFPAALPGGTNAVYQKSAGTWSYAGTMEVSNNAAVNLLATTGVGGFALQDATPTILTWTAPNDGNMHRVQLWGELQVGTTAAGGQISLSYTTPGGSSEEVQIIAGSQAAGVSYLAGNSRVTVAPSTTVSLVQATALTSGAATIYMEMWGS